ncbi:MFS transporter [Streptomyces sp. NPDC056188]|uniref:MFS transporter n=1 Tax=Streptomyces sp. NPDC056188 TaxID=3345740 RepID=UPI0035D5331F
MAGALLLGSAGFLDWLTAGPDTPYPVMLFALMATGLATPVTVVAATVAIMEASPADKAGVASAVFNVSRQVGSAMGVALFGTLLGATGGMIGGLHASAVIAAVAFLLASVLAATTGRRGRRRPVPVRAPELPEPWAHDVPVGLSGKEPELREIPLRR